MAWSITRSVRHSGSRGKPLLSLREEKRWHRTSATEMIPSAGIAEERVPLLQVAKSSIAVTEGTKDSSTATTADIRLTVAIYIGKPDGARSRPSCPFLALSG